MKRAEIKIGETYAVRTGYRERTIGKVLAVGITGPGRMGKVDHEGTEVPYRSNRIGDRSASHVVLEACDPDNEANIHGRFAASTYDVLHSGEQELADRAARIAKQKHANAIMRRENEARRQLLAAAGRVDDAVVRGEGYVTLSLDAAEAIIEAIKGVAQ